MCFKFWCFHKWVTIKVTTHKWDDGTYYYTAYHQQCDKCGKVKISNIDKPWFF